MNVENTQSQMRKGILEYCILGILNNGEAYPSEIFREAPPSPNTCGRGNRLSVIDASKKSGIIGLSLGGIYFWAST